MKESGPVGGGARPPLDPPMDLLNMNFSRGTSQICRH